MLSLPNVTLLAVSSVDLEQTELALRISSHDIEFGSIKLLTSESWVPSDPKIKIVKIPKINNVTGYSRFVLCELSRYVQTQFCLVVQADGFVLNADKWTNEFFDYDYLGAPWPLDLKVQPGNISFDLKMNSVGNGGFSLRSKALLDETAKIDFDSLNFPNKSEDLIICHFLFSQMINAGIRFPAPELAARFSVESAHASYGQNPSTSFGFHGRVLRDTIFASLKGN
jgi:hypothetical protein